MTYFIEMYTATMALPPRVWMALGMSLVAASAITAAFSSFREGQ